MYRHAIRLPIVDFKKYRMKATEIISNIFLSLPPHPTDDWVRGYQLSSFVLVLCKEEYSADRISAGFCWGEGEVAWHKAKLSQYLPLVLLTRNWEISTNISLLEMASQQRCNKEETKTAMMKSCAVQTKSHLIFQYTSV